MTKISLKIDIPTDRLKTFEDDAVSDDDRKG